MMLKEGESMQAFAEGHENGEEREGEDDTRENLGGRKAEVLHGERERGGRGGGEEMAARVLQ
ncbi:hypothetical protein, partial [Leucobacter japonicus]|uniref:hypothetical protein n=1 Tax=Leucobacter japonicus TaxID=1461259 RepID=UPI0012E32B24